MTETYRTPKAVLAELDLPASLTAAEVVALRNHGGETGAWAHKIAAAIEQRAAIIKETHMPQIRAMGADVPLADALAILLNEVFEFYARAHESHWNVVGSGADFQSFHELFGEIYEDAYSSVDPLAENIRKLGSLAPCLHVMPEEEARGVSDPGQLAAMLLEENDELVEEIRAAFDMATAAGQQGIANFLAERQDMHQKWGWQLRASLGIAEVGEPLTDAAYAEDDAEDIGEYSAEQEMEARKSLVDACEKRSIPAELRAEHGDDGMVRVRGYAAVFNQESTGLPFREVIARGAFKRSLDRGDDVFLLVNHDTDQLPLGRRSSGTLTLEEDDHGLLIEAVLDPANPRAAEVASVLARNDADEMSFAFKVAENGSRKREDGVRELTDLDLFEVSIVTWGAYNQTSVGLRAAEPEVDLDLKQRWLQRKQRQFAL